MMLTLNNLSTHNRLWDLIHLQPIKEIHSHVSKFDILETDQIKFTLLAPSGSTAAKLVVAGFEAFGHLISDDGNTCIFEWMPKKNSHFGYDAFFLHFFGIANFAIELFDSTQTNNLVVFEAINIYGRRITATRAEAMLSFISKHADSETLKALSPTSYGAMITKNGVSIADLLMRLEMTIKDIDHLIFNIIKKPITSLRSQQTTIHNPSTDQIDTFGISWIAEHAGIGEDASCESDGLFRHGFKWKSMPEVKIYHSKESTDIYENQLIYFYLARLAHEGNRIYKKCDELIKFRQEKSERDFGEYKSFFSIARKGMNESVGTYLQRSKHCINKIEKLISVFNKTVPTSKVSIRKVAVTEKIKSNRHYILFLRAMKDWIEVREINWLANNVLASINSIPQLFEYYTILSVSNWLKKESNSSQEGLFNGFAFGKNIHLLYEPSYPSAGHIKSEHSLWATDFDVNKGRRPDIVIDINRNNPNERLLLIFDAKCRSEKNVLNESLPECALKYGYGIRDISGKCPVRAVVMLHPKSETSRDDGFISFYKAPFGVFEGSTAYPILGAQRININSEGIEFGLYKLLEKIFSVHISI